MSHSGIKNTRRPGVSVSIELPFEGVAALDSHPPSGLARSIKRRLPRKKQGTVIVSDRVVGKVGDRLDVVLELGGGIEQ